MKFADFKDRVSKKKGHASYDSYADSSDGFDYASIIKDNEGDRRVYELGRCKVLVDQVGFS